MKFLQAILAAPALAAGEFSAGIEEARKLAIIQGGLSQLSIQLLASKAFAWLELLVSGLALLALVWAGIGYILAFGSQEGIAKAKKTLIYAILGIMIASSLALIRNLIICRLLKANFNFTCPAYVDLASGLLVLINLLLVPAGAMAFGALIYGGYLYMISGGDESRSSKAKTVIFYALVGLAVIGISGTVVNVFIRIL